MRLAITIRDSEKLKDALKNAVDAYRNSSKKTEAENTWASFIEGELTHAEQVVDKKTAKGVIKIKKSDAMQILVLFAAVVKSEIFSTADNLFSKNSGRLRACILDAVVGASEEFTFS